jgi:hypothetical protein
MMNELIPHKGTAAPPASKPRLNVKKLMKHALTPFAVRDELAEALALTNANA